MTDPNPPAFHAYVDRFSVYASTVVLSGWLFAPGRRLATLVLELPDGQTVPVPTGQPSPDVRAIFGQGAENVRFALRGSIAAEPDEAHAARLVATFAGGGTVVLNDLGGRGLKDDPAHGLFGRFLAHLDERDAGALLEIGSRSRSGTVRRQFVPPAWTYTGLDIVAGPNVDVVGDAHRLSRTFAPGTFAAVMSVSVVEHLAMPWKVAVELNRVMVPGGLGFFLSHHCWPLHEEPWDFWRYSAHSWKALLNRRTGFEVLETAMGEPATVVPQRLTGANAWDAAGAVDFLASGVIFRKTGEATVDWDVELDEVLDDGYPGVASVAPRTG